MLALDFIRQNKEIVSAGLKAKGYNINIEKFLSMDEERRHLILEVERLRSEKNKATEKISILKKEGRDASGILEEMKELTERIKKIDSDLSEKDTFVKEQLLFIPNIPNKDVPIGDETCNKEVRSWGKIPKFKFEPKCHDELGENNGFLDFKRASKITGSGFIIFKDKGAKLERALINYMLDVHTNKHKYQEVSPPFIVNSSSMTGTGQLPKMHQDMYKIEEEDLYLVPTAEVPVTNIYRNEVLQEDDLPLSFAAYTPCFRKEAGAYGKDTKGMSRVHQFDKVELVRFVHPDNSYEELEKLLLHAEYILQSLGLHYRVVILASGDLSFSAAKCYDIEVWAPGMKKYLEVSSCSNFEDFQSRRMSIKFKPKSGGKPEFIHTLNGSGVALARLFISFIETYQQQDGKIKIPGILRPYLGGIKYI